MRSYVPHTQDERRQMLASLNLSRMDELFAGVPAGLLLDHPLNLPRGMSESEVRRVMQAFADETEPRLPCFRGAGAYRHYIPSIVPQLISRSEFFTAYTPYQAEISQGMLQAIFEYQGLVCALTGMDASNASVYDGATACAEAMLMLASFTRKKKVLYSTGLHPDIQSVMRTYARFAGIELIPIPLTKDGAVCRNSLAGELKDAAGFFAAQPNFYGCVEDMEALASVTHEHGGLFVNYVDPLALGALKRPGDAGADIAVGEGQPLGLPLSFGGPYLGFMACTTKLLRHMPGRIAGQTTDKEGNRAFVLTLQAREQHIRREKASSNICSNQMLSALAASIYLSAMGPSGLREVAEQNIQKAHYLYDGMKQIRGVRMRYPKTPFFNEFVAVFEKDAEGVNAELYRKGILGGVPLSRFDAADTGMLWCATECNTRDEIDHALCALEEVLS